MKLRHHLTAVALAIAGAASTAFADQYALLVGIEDYSSVSGAGNLPGCLRDVDNMNNLLTRTFAVPPGNIRTLTNRKATKDNIVAGIRDLAAKAKPGDAVVFFYSGHGTQVPDLDKPAEEEDGEDESLVNADFSDTNPKSWLTDDVLRVEFSKFRTRRVTVIIDACHSGTALRDLRFGADGWVAKGVDFKFDKLMTPKSTAEGYDSIIKGADQVLFAACKSSEVAGIDRLDGAPQSIFTYYFVKTAQAMPKEPVDQVFRRLAASVSEHQKRNGKDSQTPQLEGSPSGSLSALVGPNSDDTRPAPGPLPAPSPDIATDFPVTLSVNKNSFRVGDESLQVTCTSSKAGFMRLYYVNQTGIARMVFPNKFQTNNEVRAGENIVLPGTSRKFKFVMEEPTGVEALMVVVKTEQFTDAESIDLNKELFANLGLNKSFADLADRGLGLLADKAGGVGRALVLYRVSAK